MQDLVGQNFGQYRVLERIGTGGMANVYKAFQPSLDRIVAIKVLPPVLAMDPTFLERFRREATAVASLQHPNIVQVFDFGRERGLFYLTMMFVDGGVLTDQIGRISISTALTIGSQLAGALHYAHGRNIIHRDVKAGNVLMAHADWPLLTDFGIARLALTATLTTPGTGLGTPEYISPEQAMGRPVDARSDVYSLGVLIFFMVTGRLPFQGESLSIVRQHVLEPMPLPSSVNSAVPLAIDAIVQRATRKDPAARFPTAGALKSAIDDLLASPQTTTIIGMSSAEEQTTVVLDAPAPKRIGRLPVTVGGVAAALSVCLCVAAVLAFGVNRSLALRNTGTASTSASPVPTPTPTLEFTPIPAGEILFRDDLTTNQNGWPTRNDAQGRFYFADGTYHVENLTPNLAYNIYPSRNRSSYTSFVYEAEFSKVSGPITGSYGLAFRMAADSTGYRFFVTSGGQYSLARWIASLNGWDRMIEWTEDTEETIHRGDAVNRLRVIARGPQITMYINDRWIRQVTETKEQVPKEGSFGVSVGAGVHVTLTGVRVYSAPP